MQIYPYDLSIIQGGVCIYEYEKNDHISPHKDNVRQNGKLLNIIICLYYTSNTHLSVIKNKLKLKQN